MISGYTGQFSPARPVVIAASSATSEAINMNGFSLAGIIFPATFTGTTVTFTVSDTLAGTYVPLCTTDAGEPLSYTIAQATYAAIDPKDFLGVQFVKIVSGSTEGSARTLLCSLRGV